MSIGRRTSCFLIGFAAWNAYVWGTFVWNVYPQHHWDAFFAIHLIIGSMTVIFGLVIGWIGLRGLR